MKRDLELEAIVVEKYAALEGVVVCRDSWVRRLAMNGTIEGHPTEDVFSVRSV